MLRTMRGYDEYNTILLPPRKPGDKLPQEVTDAYNEQQRKKEAEEKEKAEAVAAAQGEKVAEEAGEGAAPPVIATVPPSTRGEGTKAESDEGDGVKDGENNSELKLIIKFVKKKRLHSVMVDFLLKFLKKSVYQVTNAFSCLNN